MTVKPEPARCIRGAEWVVAYDAGTGEHVYLRDADVAFAGDRVIHVGGHYAGEVAEEISGKGRLVLPGMVNIHGHLGSEPFGKGFYEELGTHNHYMSRLYEYIYTVRPPNAAARYAATRHSVAELLLSGATTVADMSLPYEGWEDCCAETGARVYLTPMFKSASWQVRQGRIEYDWDLPAGERDMAKSLDVIEKARQHASGRLDGMVMPAQVDTCTGELMVAAAKEAKKRGFPLQIHACQSVPEFHEMVRRNGKTAIAFLHDLGVLGPNTTLAHAIIIDRHPWIHWHEQRDLEWLGSTGSSVVHCPSVFAYRGVMLHDFGAYRRAGVNMAMGTDTYPHNMAGELRLALFTAKLARGHVDYTKTADVFHAATLGGAKALGRDDLGRIAVGAAADLVLVDITDPSMVPMRDPLRCFIFSAGDRAVRDVYVAGKQVIKEGRHLTIDLAKASTELSSTHLQAMAEVPTRDWAKRSADEISPLSLKIVPSRA